MQRPDLPLLLDRLSDEYASDPDFVAEQLALEVTEEASRIMAARHLNKAGLAEMLGVSRAYVTRMLGAPPNMTLRTLAQLAIALGGRPQVTLGLPYEIRAHTVFTRAQSGQLALASGGEFWISPPPVLPRTLFSIESSPDAVESPVHCNAEDAYPPAPNAPKAKNGEQPWKSNLPSVAI